MISRESHLRLEINLTALAANWRKLRELSGSAETSAVIKADGYGLGIERVAAKLSEAGCNTFHVAVMSEAIRVRNTCPQADIYVLNGIFPEDVRLALEQKLYPVFSDLRQIDHWQSVTSQREVSTPCAIQIDTGMNRLGLDQDAFGRFVKDQEHYPNLSPRLLMSHLACADDPSDPLNIEQLDRFARASALLPGYQASLANSSGIFLGDRFLFDMTRPGIAIYGAADVNWDENPMQSVISLHSRIMQIRNVPKGGTIGYGKAGTVTRDSRIAISSGGYADGIHRALSGSGVLLRKTGRDGGVGAINGQFVPIIGRVSMDMTAFDVTDIPAETLEKAQWIELIGPNISVDDVARHCGTIGYEILTSLGSRSHRTYLEP